MKETFMEIVNTLLKAAKDGLTQGVVEGIKDGIKKNVKGLVTNGIDKLFEIPKNLLK